MTVDEELGDIQLVKIEKRKYWLHDDWYLKYITLKTPSGDYIEFPCYRWLTGEGEVVLRDGRGEPRRLPASQAGRADPSPGNCIPGHSNHRPGRLCSGPRSTCWRHEPPPASRPGSGVEPTVPGSGQHGVPEL